ncbi:MAG: PrsW family intramembrane metalloprotease [Actinomycetota bacterium]|nr:PrsW family intramembrane metalloprotease [Actinomycetota bacterium]
MSEQHPAVALPAAGHYPVPDHHGKHVVERTWDGDVWIDEIRPAPPGTRLAKHKRHMFGFLRNPGWKLLLLVIIATAAASALWATDRDTAWVHGIQILMPPLSLLATATIMLALLVFLNRRVGFDRVNPETRRMIVKWGVLSAVAGFAFALAVEIGVPKIFGQDMRDEKAWSLLAGPAEETGKLLIPVILWVKGRFRLPREGYLLVLVSACVFGTLESTEYALNPEHWEPSRVVLELMHPMFTGFIAAVAWRVAWGRESWFTGAAIGAWCVAVAVHSINDFIVLDGFAEGPLGLISIAAVVVMYLFQKHSARQLVPPDNVGKVSRHWRPRPPAHASKATEPVSEPVATARL